MQNRKSVVGLLIALVALVGLDVSMRISEPAQASQRLSAPDKVVGIGVESGMVYRMWESGAVDTYDVLGSYALHGFPFREWTRLP